MRYVFAVYHTLSLKAEIILRKFEGWDSLGIYRFVIGKDEKWIFLTRVREVKILFLFVV